MSCRPAAFGHAVRCCRYYGGQHEYRLCASHDYSEAGVQKVKAGQEFDCPVIFEFERGFMRCSAADGTGTKLIPPGTLRRCINGKNSYRSILPAHMRRPHSRPKAATAPGGAAQVGVGGGARQAAGDSQMHKPT